MSSPEKPKPCHDNICSVIKIPRQMTPFPKSLVKHHIPLNICIQILLIQVSGVIHYPFCIRKQKGFQALLLLKQHHLFSLSWFCLKIQAEIMFKENSLGRFNEVKNIPISLETCEFIIYSLLMSFKWLMSAVNMHTSTVNVHIILLKNKAGAYGNTCIWAFLKLSIWVYIQKSKSSNTAKQMCR